MNSKFFEIYGSKILIMVMIWMVWNVFHAILGFLNELIPKFFMKIICRTCELWSTYISFFKTECQSSIYLSKCYKNACERCMKLHQPSHNSSQYFIICAWWNVPVNCFKICNPKADFSIMSWYYIFSIEYMKKDMSKIWGRKKQLCV